jgi:uncharacterized protein YhhL (DUF1145 family)
MDKVGWVKLGVCALYLLLVWVCLALPLTWQANVSLGLLVAVSATHAYECIIYRDMVAEAPGSGAWNYLNVFLFGVIHKLVMKHAIRDARR